MNNDFLAKLFQDNMSLTPREIAHAPERVKREEERERGNDDGTGNHPVNHVPLPLQTRAWIL